MPHDATPPNGRMYQSGVPGWMVALALALVFSTAVAVVALATGLFIVLLPGFAIVALGYALYLVIAARRRRERVRILEPWRSVIEEGRGLRRRVRHSRGMP